jgi:hypothetical protein
VSRGHQSYPRLGGTAAAVGAATAAAAAATAAAAAADAADAAYVNATICRLEERGAVG